MFFRKKINGSLERLRKQREQDAEKRPEDGLPVEKHDLPAMIFSAFLVIMPVCIVVLLLLAGLVLLVFHAW